MDFKIGDTVKILAGGDANGKIGVVRYVAA